MKRRLTIALIVILLATMAWVLWHRTESTDHVGRSGSSGPAQPETQKAQSKTQSAAADRSTLADALNSPTADIRADLQLVADIVGTFRSNFPRDGNPVGSNAEITAALSGKNKLGLSLIPADHRAIDRQGNLCDRWGTPFFFHAQSATQMEIRSAGPDKKMWSDDDIVLTP